MLGGRDFTDAELAPGSSERVAIIDDALAQRLWPGEDALGRLIQFLDAERTRRRAAASAWSASSPAVKHSLGNPRPSPHVYVPLGQHYESAMTLQLRITEENAERAMLATIARVVRECRRARARPPCRDVAGSSRREPRRLALSRRRQGVLGVRRNRAAAGRHRRLRSQVVRRVAHERASSASGSRPAHIHVPCCGRCCERAAGPRAIGIGIGLLLALGAGQFLQSVLYGVNSRRTGRAVDGAADPARLVAPRLFHSGASRHESRPDCGAALRVTTPPPCCRRDEGLRFKLYM